MTNAEKYLKDGISIEELIFDIINFEKCWNRKDFDKEVKRIKKFFFTSSKPVLTEDERVILRNIVYDSEYKYIYRSLGMLYLSENERLTCIDRLPAMHHLFKFIKERRRI